MECFYKNARSTNNSARSTQACLKIRLQSMFVIHCIIATVLACTEFILPCLDKSLIVGRTFMFNHKFDFHIVTEPKGTEHHSWEFPHGSSCYGKTPMKWLSKTANIFIEQQNFSPAGPVDGQNADGLSVAALYFEHYAQYPKASNIPEEKCDHTIPHFQIGEFIQTQYSKTQEVRDAINNDEFPFVWGGISHVPLPNKPGKIIDFMFPIHWSIIDKTGDALVLEYTAEGRKIHNNTIGVVTNPPTYDWHMTNLKNYVNLQNRFEPKLTYEFVSGKGAGIIEGYYVESGGHGIPGDFTSPSRFVRTVMITQFTEKPKNAKEGAIKAWHIHNALGFPHGIGETMYWTIVRDLTNNVIYFRDKNYLSIRMIDLNKASKTNIEYFRISDDFFNGVKDVTGEMKSSK